MKKIFLFILNIFLLSFFLFSQKKDDNKKIVYQFDIKENITPAIWRTTQKSFKEANKINADYIIIHMNTYGGILESADSIRRKIMYSKIPVFVFIDGNAASAGALISIACDSIYMRKGSTIGAATVVNQSGEKVSEKYQGYMRGMMRGTAETKGKYKIIENGKEVEKWKRNPEIAEAMVDDRIKIDGIIDSAKILTFTSSEAIKYGFCENEAENIIEVLELANIENYEIKKYKYTSLEKFILLFLSPYLQGILIMIIIGGIYFELQTPGIGFPIIASIIASVLYFSPLYLEGLAENWEILVFIIGIILIALEVFVVPGFGITGISGTILTIFALTISLIDNIIFSWDIVFASNIFLKSLFFVSISIFLSFLISLYAGSKIITSGNFGFLVLKSTQKKETGFIGVETKNREMIGEIGKAITDLRPSGKIQINEKIYDAKSEMGFLEKNQMIKVIRYETGQLYVIKAYLISDKN